MNHIPFKSSFHHLKHESSRIPDIIKAVDYGYRKIVRHALFICGKTAKSISSFYPEKQQHQVKTP